MGWLQETIRGLFEPQETVGVADTERYKRAVQEFERKMTEGDLTGERKIKEIMKFLRSSGAEGLLRNIKRSVWREGKIVYDSWVGRDFYPSYVAVILKFDHRQQVEDYDGFGRITTRWLKLREHLSITIADFPIEECSVTARPAEFARILPGRYFVLDSRNGEDPDGVYRPAHDGKLYVPLADSNTLKRVRGFLQKDTEKRRLEHRLPRDLTF